MASSDTKLSRILLPTNGGIFFVLLLALFLFERPLQLLSDGGTARHIITGQYFLETGHLPTTNHITHFFSHSPWLTNSFLSDTIFGAMYNAAGLNGIVLIGALAIALSITWSYQMSRARGMSAPVGMILSVLVMFVMSLHWSARPHILTYLPFLASYYLLFVWNTTYRTRLVVVSLIMLVWANMHGSFYLGVGMLLCKLIGDVLAPPFIHSEPADRQQNNLWNVATLLCALAMCSINASGGANFLTYIIPYFQHVTTQITNDEWRSVDFGMGIRIWLFMGMAILQFAIWTYSPRRPLLAEFLYASGLFLFGVYSMRMIPYYALLMPVVCAASLDALLPAKLNERILELDARVSASEPRSLKTGIVWTAVAVLLCGIWLATPGFAVQSFDPQSLPVECAKKLKNLPRESFGFTRDNWAGYLYLTARHPIFIDDYHNYYPAETVDDYRKIYYAEQGWKQLLEKYRFDWVLVPSNMPLQLYLRRTPEWKLVCADHAGALFVKSDSNLSDNSGPE